jgi:hypothetical protein
MTRGRCTFSALALLASASLLALGCSNRIPSGGDYPRLDAKRIGARAIEQLDTNGDGRLDSNELNKSPGLRAAIARLDPNGTGYVTSDTIAKRIEQWQASKIGRMRIICSITHNGVPLADAVVRFVPEGFLGDTISIASGRTDERGTAVLSIPGFGSDDLLGVPPGFYRVEITKTGLNIPAKYSSDTILGAEVAIDVVSIEEGVRFDIVF